VTKALLGVTKALVGEQGRTDHPHGTNMSLLSVTVSRAELVGPTAAQNSSYVTLKLQNVKSTTVPVKGKKPTWNQDFLFEVSDLDTGLLLEVWEKGLLWDKAIGYHWCPLTTVAYSKQMWSTKIREVCRKSWSGSTRS